MYPTKKFYEHYYFLDYMYLLIKHVYFNYAT